MTVNEECLELIKDAYGKLKQAYRLMNKNKIPFLALLDRTKHVHLLIEQLEIRVANQKKESDSAQDAKD